MMASMVLQRNGVFNGTRNDPPATDGPSAKQINIGQQHPVEKLTEKAKKLGCDISDIMFATYMDSQDKLKELRKEFFYPKMKDLNHTDLNLVDPEEDCVYFCGNSLGLCPRKTKEYMEEELDKWAKKGVQGHKSGTLPWEKCDEVLDSDMARLVGARDGEVALMNGLTVNLHCLLISFYRPTPQRYKIMLEAKAFPSDHYAIESQIHQRGYDPKKCMILVEPREGEDCLRTEDILSRIEEDGDSIAVICFSGVQYYTGQLFDMETITKAGQKKGCYVGWDLAHAAGNVELKLHDWNVDFACWCTYKYMNSSAGCLAGMFLHERHKENKFPKLLGWWGHHLSSRFMMDNNFEPYSGAHQYRCSNTPGLLCPPLRASLEIFNKTSMAELRAKSQLLTTYLEALILQKHGLGTNSSSHQHVQMNKDFSDVHVEIITPSDPEQRGAQLSLSFSVPIKHVFIELEKRGVVCDERQPNVIRVAPAPLYCSFQDVHRFMKYLDQAIRAVAKAYQTGPSK